MRKERDKELKYYKKKTRKVMLFYTLTVISFFFAFAYPILIIPGVIFFIIAVNGDTAGYWGKVTRLQSGNAGMEKTIKVLQKLPKSYSIYEYVTVQNEGKKTVIDFVVVGNNGVFLIDAMNVGGMMIGREQSSSWRIGDSEFKNPIKKSKWQIHMLSSNLKKDGLKGYITGILYIAGQLLRVDEYFQPGDYPIFDRDSSKELYNFIQKNYNGPKILDSKKGYVKVGL